MQQHPHTSQQHQQPPPQFAPVNSLYGSVPPRSASAATSNNNSLDSLSLEHSVGPHHHPQQHMQHQFSPFLAESGLPGQHPPRPVSAIQHNPGASNNSIYSSLTGDSSFASLNGNSTLSLSHAGSMQTTQQAKGSSGDLSFGQLQQMQRSPGFAAQASTQQQSTPPPHAPMAPVGRPVQVGVAALAPQHHVNFDSSAAAVSDSHSHEFSHRSLHAGAVPDFSKSLANMSLGDLHQFDEALDLSFGSSVFTAAGEGPTRDKAPPSDVQWLVDKTANSNNNSNSSINQ